jgi:(p)ppGpp synthase/HD superfamily hydrolase
MYFEGEYLKLVDKARIYAFAAHHAIGHMRKYTGEPYVFHLREVADMVQLAGGTEEMVAAAYLHDILEDTEVPYNELWLEFGDTVANYVQWLSDATTLADGNRKTRKQIERDRYYHAPPEVQTIKLADLISNAGSICNADKKFAEIYMNEKRDLLPLLCHGDTGLYTRAWKIIHDYFNIADPNAKLETI